MTKLHFTGMPQVQESLAELRARYGDSGPEQAEIVVLRPKLDGVGIEVVGRISAPR